MCELVAGTSSRNKIFQLFPKDTPEPEVEVEVLPGTVHAWSVGPSALKASARQVYEKMLHPSLGGRKLAWLVWFVGPVGWLLDVGR